MSSVSGISSVCFSMLFGPHLFRVLLANLGRPGCFPNFDFVFVCDFVRCSYGAQFENERIREFAKKEKKGAGTPPRARNPPFDILF